MADIASNDTTSFDPDQFTRRRSRLLATPRRRTIAATASTAVFFGVLTVAFFLAPGSAQVRFYYFDMHYMWQSFKGDPTLGYYSVAKGFIVTVEMFLIAEPLILILALVIALVRLSTSPVLLPFRIVGTAYVDFFRGVPLLLIMLGVGFGVPALRLPVISTQSAFVYGVAVLVLAYSAFVSEVYRAGIWSVPLGQVAAARSMGLRYRTAQRYVILPQAIRSVIPPLLNDFISLQKDTALVSVLGTVIESVRASEVFSSYSFNYSAYTLGAVLFLLVTIPLTRFTDHMIARDRERRLAGGMP